MKSHHEHEPAVDLDRAARPIDSLDQHSNCHSDKQECTAEGREHLGTLESERPFHGGSPTTRPVRSSLINRPNRPINVVDIDVVRLSPTASGTSGSTARSRW